MISGITKEIYESIPALRAIQVLIGKHRMNLSDLQKAADLSWGYVQRKLPQLVEYGLLRRERVGKEWLYDVDPYGKAANAFLTKILPDHKKLLEMNDMIVGAPMEFVLEGERGDGLPDVKRLMFNSLNREEALATFFVASILYPDHFKVSKIINPISKSSMGASPNQVEFNNTETWSKGHQSILRLVATMNAMYYSTAWIKSEDYWEGYRAWESDFYDIAEKEHLKMTRVVIIPRNLIGSKIIREKVEELINRLKDSVKLYAAIQEELPAYSDEKIFDIGIFSNLNVVGYLNINDATNTTWVLRKEEASNIDTYMKLFEELIKEGSEIRKIEDFDLMVSHKLKNRKS